MLVSLSKDFYRCITCGSDLEQKINGVIKYIPSSIIKKEEKPEAQWLNKIFLITPKEIDPVKGLEDTVKTLINLKKDH